MGDRYGLAGYGSGLLAGHHEKPIPVAQVLTGFDTKISHPKKMTG